MNCSFSLLPVKKEIFLAGIVLGWVSLKNLLVCCQSVTEEKNCLVGVAIFTCSVGSPGETWPMWSCLRLPFLRMHVSNAGMSNDECIKNFRVARLVSCNELGCLITISSLRVKTETMSSLIIDVCRTGEKKAFLIFKSLINQAYIVFTNSFNNQEKWEGAKVYGEGTFSNDETPLFSEKNIFKWRNWICKRADSDRERHRWGKAPRKGRKINLEGREAGQGQRSSYM